MSRDYSIYPAKAHEGMACKHFVIVDPNGIEILRECQFNRKQAELVRNALNDVSCERGTALAHEMNALPGGVRRSAAVVRKV